MCFHHYKFIVALYRLQFFIFLALSFTLTHLPSHKLPKVPDYLAGIQHLDKWVHFCLYFVLASLFARSFGARTPTQNSLSNQLYFLLFYALFDESTQPITGRSFSVSDIMADLAGGWLGLIYGNSKSLSAKVWGPQSDREMKE